MARMSKEERSEGRNQRRRDAIAHLQRRIETLVENANTTKDMNLTLHQRSMISSRLNFLMGVRDRTLQNLDASLGIEPKHGLDHPAPTESRTDRMLRDIAHDETQREEIAVTEQYMSRIDRVPANADTMFAL